MKYKTKIFKMLGFVALGFIANYCGSALAGALRMPVFFDSLGTVLTTAIAGFWPGMWGGVVYNIITISTLGQLSAALWAISSIFVAFLVWLLIKFKKLDFGNYRSVFKAGLITGALNAVLTSFITILFFSSTESFAPAIALQQIFAGIFHNSAAGIFLAHIFIEVIDKSIVFLAAFGIYKMIKPMRT